ncbi:DddA-like double-stranded DNA deaminase toxin [Actinoallomurus acaciae]|uniref:DddA-like double-stranded DNA deaminase toxin n=1 Tax=Actinoallomurus acaciae TaxID=502577 RepID=A0ABV5YCB7_9ACTN
MVSAAALIPQQNPRSPYETEFSSGTGDKVLAADPKTGKVRAEPVIASFGGTNYKKLIKITVDTDGKSGHKTGVIIATEHHKFWNAVTHAWTRADHLTRQDTLRTPTGKSVRVISAAPRPGHPVVRDLTVAKLHTFYVKAGDAPVLVHNCFDPAEAGAGLPKYTGPTSGSGVAADGRTYDVVSGNKRGDADLLKIVNGRLRGQGVLPGAANSARASDAEQKFAAIMIRDGIDDANLVINNPTGPCMVRLGCDNVLNTILGPDKTLTVHWPDGSGGWASKKYGGTP